MTTVRGGDATIRFEDSDGLEYTFEHKFSAVYEGAEVEVIYPPRDPDRAQLPGDPDRGPDLIGFAVVAFTVAVLLGWLDWLLWREWPRQLRGGVSSV